jgi:hypothetical protein
VLATWQLDEWEDFQHHSVGMHHQDRHVTRLLQHLQWLENYRLHEVADCRDHLNEMLPRERMVAVNIFSVIIWKDKHQFFVRGGPTQDNQRDQMKLLKGCMHVPCYGLKVHQSLCKIRVF